MNNVKLGVVLSGGGAKGAYEAGFLKALSEFNIQPDAISGTSIGALNGAIYASTKDTKKSAKLLEELWNDLAVSSVLKVDEKKVILNIIEVFSFFSHMPISKLSKIIMTALKTKESKEGFLTQLPILDRLQMFANEESLINGLPFYVGITKSKGNLVDLLNFFGFGDEEAVFKKIQDLNKEDIHKTIMASAALPLFFDAIELDGEMYRDGCLGSTENEWGNTPAKPLIVDEKCTHIIVCHLNEGSFFNRYDPIFKNTSIIEIRPENGTFLSVMDPLKFNVEKIDIWMKQGYHDSKRILRDSLKAIFENKQREITESFAEEAVDKLKKRKFSLN